MARIEHSHLPSYFNETIQGEEKYTLNLYNIPNDYNYNKDGYQSQTSSENSTYRGTIEIPAGLTQKGVNNNYPLMHAKDIQIGNNEANRLTDKLADYDQILRELYGREPNKLEDKTDGRTNEEIAILNQQEKRSKEKNNFRDSNGNGLQSLDKIATVLNNRTETIDDRLLDLRMFKNFIVGFNSQNSNNYLINDSFENLSNEQLQEEKTNRTLVANNNSDTLTIDSENQWVVLKANVSNNRFTIGHYVNSINTTTDTKNLNTDSNMVLQVLGYDIAGHIISKKDVTYTLPYNFKTISISNAVTDNVSDIDITNNNNTSIEANSPTADMQFIAGNKWIKLIANNQNRSITLGHATSGVTAGTYSLIYNDLEGKTLKFGDEFSITNPSISCTIDAAGHITAYSVNNNTVTMSLPQPSIELDSNSPGQIITNITKVDTEGNNGGEFKYTKTNIGALLLTGYNSSNNITVTDVADTDSLNNAIFKLQKQIKTLDIADIFMDKDATQLETLYSYITNLNEDIANFKIKYNQLITQLASDLSWTDEIKTELQLDVPAEEPTENTGE